MHTISQRLNSVSALTTTSIIILTIAITIISFIQRPSIQPARIEISDIETLWGHDKRDHYDRKDREWTNIRFDIEADLRPLFNYNTKQIFVFLSAKFGTDNFPNNEVILWDRIIKSSKDAKINLTGAKNKYAFKHIGGSFKNSNATYILHYNLMPKVGALIWGEAGKTKNQVPFPEVNYRKPIRTY
ncbi:signal peptidase complex subunit 3 [Phakopsora pachyrhizi]|uniref:Signal peptidase subunit 3 n=1 Tax=Phakopsora pachyrhizi TaxID=170000 RepID=A0A0S1MK10_PHAPC|nr:signal peptidase complex subunit 3 [Phakopsora pachyrhizi]KAI8457296.1 signal peptidase complex subunit 3 [Phakopsora pachyrhizi]CAH7666481.1 signal peptidase complex subunit 3 [Phakopsora pachyrhizi]